MVDLRPDQLATVRAILLAEVPDCEVLAFGSRAKWTAKDSSDLDLALRAAHPLPLSRLGRLRDAFEESYLPVKVDVLDIHRISPEFRSIIEKEHVMLQKPNTAPGHPEREKQWRTMPLEECMETIIDYRGKTPRKVDRGIPLITAKVVKGGRIEEPNEFLAPEDYEGWMRRGLPKPGDVLLTMEAPLGEVAQLDERKVALAQRLVALRGKSSLMDNTFLRYALQSETVQDQLRSRATGTTVQGIRQSELRKISLPVPSMEEQRKIARVLRTLDDKIELNRRMDTTLEAMARALFQSWFVDFDPVRAKLDGRDPIGLDPETAALFPAAFEESSLGEIPKGWRTGTFGELVELRTDRLDAKPSKDHLRYIALEDMPSKSIDLSGFQLGSAVNSSIIAFRKGDVLFGSMRPYFHKVGLTFFDGITRTTTFVLRPRKDCFRHFALLHFFSDDVVAYSTTASVGTTIPYVKWESLESYRVPMPPDSLLAVFEEAVSPLVQRIAYQGEESLTLTTLRDTLLPKLLSGELSVLNLQ